MEDRSTEVVPYGSAYGLRNLLAQEALRTAAVIRLDHATLALAELHVARDLQEVFAEHVPGAAAREYLLRCAAGEEPMQEFAVGDLPTVYAKEYRTFGFLKNWIVTVTTVGWKLAQPEFHPLSNVAEELALHVLVEDAVAHLELREAAPQSQEDARAALIDLYESSYEDNDFLALYELRNADEVSGLDASWTLGSTDLRLREWFEPFGSGVDRGVPHPFVLDRDSS